MKQKIDKFFEDLNIYNQFMKKYFVFISLFSILVIVLKIPDINYSYNINEQAYNTTINTSKQNLTKSNLLKKIQFFFVRISTPILFLIYFFSGISIIFLFIIYILFMYKKIFHIL
jgi:hypothetical protein